MQQERGKSLATRDVPPPLRAIGMGMKSSRLGQAQTPPGLPCMQRRGRITAQLTFDANQAIFFIRQKLSGKKKTPLARGFLVTGCV